MVVTATTADVMHTYAAVNNSGLSICLYVAGLGSIIAVGVSRIKRKVGE